MSKRFVFLTFFVLVLGMVGSVSAQDEITYWTDDGGDHLWCNPSNWDNGLPEFNPDLTSWETRGADGIINIEGITDAVLIGPGCEAEAAWVGVGCENTNTGPSVALNMTGGTFSAMEITLGECDGGYGWMTMSGGMIDLVDYCYLAVGSNGGTGRLDMTGGTINALGKEFTGSIMYSSDLWSGTVRLPKNEGTCEGNDGVGHIQLDGGTINCRCLVMSDNGTMDITGGKMTIHDDQDMVEFYFGAGPNTMQDYVNGWIADGNLTAYGGSGLVGIAIRAPEDANEPNEVWILGRLTAGTAWNPIPENGAVDILPDIVLEWSAGDYVQATNGHELYFGTSFAEVNSRSVTPVVLSSATYDAGANEALELAKTYYWAIDEVNSTTTWAGPVWSFATDRGVAKDPDPADGADEIPKMGATLSWTPGIAAATTNGHDVYFGTDETAVYNANTSSDEFQTNRTEPNWSTTNYASTLDLVTTYYWRIDEVNGSDLWKGDVWSFEVEGRAKNPGPEDGEQDVPFLGLTLSWDAGVDTLTHDVYFGTDRLAVLDANTNSAEYETTLSAGTESYTVPGQLIVGGRYYWRIDENSASVTAKGHVWSFKVGPFLLVDDFESYGNNTALWNIWDDYWVNGSDGLIWRENDVNIIREPDSQAVKLEFENVAHGGSGFIGSQFDVQDMTEVEIGSDWTAGGVKALFMYLRGDPCNAQVVPSDAKGNPIWDAAQPWIELEDTSSNTGYVVYPRPELAALDSWFEWQIDLGIIDACGVTLSAIDRFTIGIGGDVRTAQKSKMTGPGYIYVDDIRLYPPRCRPELGALVGDFTDDCNVMYDDLDVMATDWLLADGDTPTENRPATLTGFPDATSHWVTGYMGGAIEVNEGYNIDVNDPRLYGVASMSITAWVKQPIINEWVGIVSSREGTCGDDASEIGIYGGQYGGPGAGALGYDWSCGTEEWQWDAGLDVPDLTWTFCVMVLDPNGCTLYMRPDGGALQTGIRNEVAHALQQNFAQSFMIGRSNAEGGYFIGAIDDVRIYAYALDFNDVNDLAYQTADPNPAPVYHYKFDETTGYTAADSGTPTDVYGPVQSVANLTDPEAKNSRFLNFADYAIFTDNWMEQLLWPNW